MLSKCRRFIFARIMCKSEIKMRDTRYAAKVKLLGRETPASLIGARGKGKTLPRTARPKDTWKAAHNSASARHCVLGIEKNRKNKSKWTGDAERRHITKMVQSERRDPVHNRNEIKRSWLGGRLCISILVLSTSQVLAMRSLPERAARRRVH